MPLNSHNPFQILPVLFRREPTCSKKNDGCPDVGSYVGILTEKESEQRCAVLLPPVFIFNLAVYLLVPPTRL